MRTYFYLPVCFVILLIVCLMFAPARRITGDRELAGRPSNDPPPATTTGLTKSFADLCRDDPVEAVATSMRKYRAEVEGYTCTLHLRERIDGKLREPETIECDFRDSPFAVWMHWLGVKEGAETMLYAAGDNRDMILVVPANDTLKKTLKLLGKTHAKRTLTSSDAKAASRYPANEFGIYSGSARTYDAWQAARDRGTLRTEYLGLQPVPELDDKPCHVIRRTCLTPEEDGLTQVTIQFDPDTLLQVGAVLMAGDELIGHYHFRDVKRNPKFERGHFAAERLK